MGFYAFIFLITDTKEKLGITISPSQLPSRSHIFAAIMPTGLIFGCRRTKKTNSEHLSKQAAIYSEKLPWCYGALGGM